MLKVKHLFKIGIVAAFMATAFLTTPSCDLFKEVANDSTLLDSLQYALGWNSSSEQLTNIEDDVNFGFSNSSLPSSVDLRTNFPPIGNQGQYGTCVAWAVAYNHMTFLEAKEKGLTTSQLGSSKAFSPKDLFWTISNANKGAACNGTNFETAYDVLLKRGVATLSTVPYTSLGSCSASTTGGENEASGHKISNYREITFDKATIKGYLAEGRAVVFGAKLGDEFMSASDASVLSYQTFGYTGQHAYHAMILSGYDDTKGSNGAFRVVNSWGESWGDKGCLWVDQTFFSGGDFAFCAFVAQVPSTNPDQNNDNVVDDPTSGYDVIAWNLVDEDYDDPDYPNDLRDRFITYNVFNGGKTTLKASDDWAIFYGLANAYDANDNNILIYDYYTNDFGTYGNYDVIDYNDAKALGSSVNWWNNIDVPSGKSVASELVQADNFTFSYDIPSSANGYYYFILWADGSKKYLESDEDNNFLFFAQSDGNPIYIQNGIIASSNVFAKSAPLKKGIPHQNEATSNYNLIKKGNPNAYTPKELAMKFNHGFETGYFKAAALKYAAAQKNSQTKNKAVTK
jgi:hypothetical protein